MSVQLAQFHQSYAKVLYQLNDEKRLIVDAPARTALHVVAGPGTGKTATLVARILKLVLVDRVPPSGIIATTFTKKAAHELRSRILEVGLAVQDALEGNVEDESDADWLGTVDINQVWTGTTDSLCQELLTQHRSPGQLTPVVADEFVSRTLMLQEGIFGGRRYRSLPLKGLLSDVTGNPRQIPARMRDVTLDVRERTDHDQLNLEDYVAESPPSELEGRLSLVAALDAYRAAMAKRHLADYAELEAMTLQRLLDGALKEFTSGLHALFVDEYQDTNLLQESLYLELAAECGGSVSVVGDDDQSLYRFRGATVELFTNYPNRAQRKLGRRPKTRFLTQNHRSTESVVEFVNGFVALDSTYQGARSAKKPRLQGPGHTDSETPVLAMFRDSREELAADLTRMLHAIFRGKGFPVPGHGRIERGEGGDLGDSVLLTYSPKEDRPDRLVSLLRSECSSRAGMGIFNPRGYPPTEHRSVQLMTGLMLQALDPKGTIETIAKPFGPDAQTLQDWRRLAEAETRRNRKLAAYVGKWNGRESDKTWPSRTPVLELVYEVAQLIGGILNDPEEQLLVEMLTRQIAASELLGSYGGQILLNRDGKTRAGNPLGDRSIVEIMRNVTIPLASGAASINEELMEDFPRDRLPILSIHQAKGLEFPLVIVDVGSRFASNHSKQARMRFPSEGDTPHRMEDHFRAFSPLGVPSRPALDRAFDDLIRQYFVAFSRPRNVLILVGLNASRPGGSIPNVALGWTREGGDSAWSVAQPYLEI